MELTFTDNPGMHRRANDAPFSHCQPRLVGVILSQSYEQKITIKIGWDHLGVAGGGAGANRRTSGRRWVRGGGFGSRYLDRGGGVLVGENDAALKGHVLYTTANFNDFIIREGGR